MIEVFEPLEELLSFIFAGVIVTCEELSWIGLFSSVFPLKFFNHALRFFVGSLGILLLGH